MDAVAARQAVRRLRLSVKTRVDNGEEAGCSQKCRLPVS